MPRMPVSVMQMQGKDEIVLMQSAERLSSSVMRSLQFHMRHSPEVGAVLGDRVRLEEPPWCESHLIAKLHYC